MLDSVRVRLTLWYTAVLALVLVLLSALTYFLYAREVMGRTDSNLAELSDAFATTFRAELRDSAGPEGVRQAARESMMEHRFRNTLFVLLDPSLNVFESSFDLPQFGFSRENVNNEILSSQPFRGWIREAVSHPGSTVTLPGGKDGFRAVARPLGASGNDFTLVLMQSLHLQAEMLQDIRATFLLAIPISLLLASLGGYFLARKSLAPVAAMASQARSIGATSLNARIAVPNERDELGQLAASFNQLLGRLENSFEQQRRFLADASHELRTPVAILRGEAEVTLSKTDRSPEEYRETLGILLEESRRLAKVIEDLLTLTRADAGQYPLALREVYLDEVASEVLQRARSLALAHNIMLSSEIESDLPLRADEALLGRMLLNLLDNAIKYSPEGSTVKLACSRERDRYLVRVSDSGPGIPPELQARIFERFFRADQARSHSEGDLGGAGLGLAIARWIVEAHHGRLELTRSDASGSTFTVTLPGTGSV